MEYKFNTIPEAIEDIANGKFVVVMDDEDRENEGDLICSAELCTPDMINFMATKARGLICTPLTRQRARELELHDMVSSNTSLHNTRFTVSVDYLHDTTTGISTADRAKTVRAIADPNTKPTDLGRPGHIFPIEAVEGGVLRRAGHTEAVVDLMRLAGLKPIGVLCEVMNEDGTMARRANLMQFVADHELKIITVQELIAYRLSSEKLIRRVAEAKMPTDYGVFDVMVYQNVVDGKEHVALKMGNINPDDSTLVRAHSECLTGDIFGSLRCDCGPQLHAAMKKIGEVGQGVVLYMRQEGRGIGLINKLKAYKLQENGLDTVEANEELGFKSDLRDYGIGAQMLVDLGVRKMRLLTNNPRKIVGLSSYGLEVVERVPIEVPPNSQNEGYLRTKQSKMGHLLHL